MIIPDSLDVKNIENFVDVENAEDSLDVENAEVEIISYSQVIENSLNIEKVDLGMIKVLKQ